MRVGFTYDLRDDYLREGYSAEEAAEFDELETIEAIDAALASYRGGVGALATVLEARRSELEARLSLLQQEQAAAKAWAWLQFVRPMKEGS